MYEPIVEEIETDVKRLASTQRTGIEALLSLHDEAGNRISISAPIADGDRSLSDLDTLTSTIIKFAEGFKTNKNWSFVPRGWLYQFRDALKNTANSFDNLVANIASIDSQHGGLKTIDASAFSITTTSGTIIDLRKILSNISLNIDSAFAAYFQLRVSISAPRLTEFGSLFSMFSSRRQELDSLSRELSSLEKQ